MPLDRSNRVKIKNRSFSALPPGHISVQLFSNSGQVPLKELGYRIMVSVDRILEGQTDPDGVVEHDNVPQGEYEMTLEGHDETVMIPALPNEVSRHPIRVSGYMLYTDNEPEPEESFDDYEAQEEVDLNAVDEEDWEDMGE
jgi:hypothetical protein